MAPGATAATPATAAAAEATLEAASINVALGGRPVLRGVSCRFGRGWTAIVGPNGAGKSTLLRALAGLLPLQGGQVRLEGRALADWPARERARRLAWLAQQGEESGDLVAREIVALGRLPHLGLFGAPGPSDEAAIDRAMAATECTAWSQRRLQALSGGERQRVLLARALAGEAPALLLDEPTTHLDPPHQVALVRLMRRLAATHTVVAVLHDLPLALLADRLVVLKDGRVVAQGRSDEAALHRALEATFDHAVAIEAGADGPQVRPRWFDSTHAA